MSRCRIRPWPVWITFVVALVGLPLVSWAQEGQLVPPDAMAHFERGRALLEAGALEDALVEASQAVWAAPHWSAAHVLRGGVLMELGRYQTAIESFDRALLLDPGLEGARRLREQAIKRLEEARALERELTGVDPSISQTSRETTSPLRPWAESRSKTRCRIRS